MELGRYTFIATIFCLLWNDPDQAAKSLPDTRTKLYQETIASLWKRYHYEKKGLSVKDIFTEEFKLKLMNFLEDLGKVTVKGIIDQGIKKVLFHDSDFEETILSLALGVGILRKERLRSKWDVKTLVKFAHSSFQDFCSAIHLASLQLGNNEECKQQVEKVMWACTLRKVDVLIFCAGHKPETSKLIVSQVVAIHNIHYQIRTDQERLERVPGYPEMQILSKSILTGKIAKYQAEGIPFDTELKIAFNMNFVFEIAFEAQLNYDECSELLHILLHSSSPHHLYFDQIEKLVQYQLNLLKPITDTNKGLFFSNLTHIWFMHPIEYPQYEPLIVSMLMYTRQLLTLTINLKFFLAPNQVSQLSEMFDALAGLKHMNTLSLARDSTELIKHNTINQQGTVDISKSLLKLCHLKLQKLELHNITITATSMSEFLSAINKSLNSWLSIVITPSDHITQNTFSMMRAISEIQTLSNFSWDMSTSVKVLRI